MIYTKEQIHKIIPHRFEMSLLDGIKTIDEENQTITGIINLTQDNWFLKVIFPIKEVFKEHAAKVKVSSIKSSIGHTLGAAGAIEAIAISKALETGIVPGTINSNGDGEGCDLDYMINGSEKINPTYAISNSFGFGGHNGTLVFKKWEGK